MAEQISIVQAQLWAVIGLLIVFVVGNILCTYWRRRDSAQKRSEPQLDDLWQKDQLDELISSATRYLQTYPNNQTSLYFLAKAYMARGQFAEAKVHLERLARIEPSLRDSWQPYLDELNASAGS